MKADGTPSTIFLKGDYGRFEEARAAGAIRPGDAVKFDTAGALVVNPTANFPGPTKIATEDNHALRGKGITDNYASGDLVSYRDAANGDLIWGWLLDGENVVIGDYLTLAVGGAFRKYVAPAAAADHPEVRGIAKEALNLVGGAAADGRLRIEITH